jgi:hypothetical protein
VTSDSPKHRPGAVESAMAANAKSRDHQGRAQDRARHVDAGGRQMFASIVDDEAAATRRASGLDAEQLGGDEDAEPGVDAAKKRSARLLLEASDRAGKAR